MVLSEERSDPVNDLLSRILESLRVRVLWSVQLSAVTTTVAVADLANLVEAWTVLPLSGPLPWILTTVSEEDVGTGSVKATLVDRRLLSLREDVASDLSIEDVSAVLGEIGLVDDWATHGVLCAHRLVPAVFCAVLEAPGAPTAVNIDCRACNNVSVIASWIVPTELDQGISDVLLALTL